MLDDAKGQAQFGRDKIDYLVADRELVGKNWINLLIQEQLSFYIRVRKNMCFDLRNGNRVKASWLLQSQAFDQPYFHPKIMYLKGALVYFSGMLYLGKGEGGIFDLNCLQQK